MGTSKSSVSSESSDTDMPGNSQDPVAPPLQVALDHAESSEKEAPEPAASSLPTHKSSRASSRSVPSSPSATPQRQLPQKSSTDPDSRSSEPKKPNTPSTLNRPGSYTSPYPPTQHPQLPATSQPSQQQLPAASQPSQHQRPKIPEARQYQFSASAGPPQYQFSPTPGPSYHQFSPIPGSSHHQFARFPGPPHQQFPPTPGPSLNQFSPIAEPSRQTLQSGTTSLISSVEKNIDGVDGATGEPTTRDRDGKIRARGPNLTRREKLTLAKLCNQHSAQYVVGNWGKFWIKVGKELKEATGREHRAIQNTVERWIKTRQTELFEQKMESGTEEERNTFMEAIDKFTECWKRSHDKAAERPTGKKTTEEESHNIQQARYDIMMGKAADESIEVEDDDSPDEDAAPRTDKRGESLAAEDKMADTFCRIADYLISSGDKGHREERGRKRQRSESECQDSERRGKKRRSDSASNIQTEMMAQLLAKMTEMNQNLLILSKRLDDMKKKGPR